MADASTYTTIGAILAVTASLCNAVGYTVQKQGHTRLKEFNKGKEENEKKRLIKEKVWATGFGIYLVGGMLNAVSLFYAPQSLVLPLSATTLVANTYGHDHLFLYHITLNGDSPPRLLRGIH